MEQVGILYINKKMKICFVEGNQTYYCVDEDKLTEFKPEDAVMYLLKPWDKIWTKTDEKGIHYISYVYDGIYIDIWAETLEKLLNLICDMLTPSEEMEDWILDKAEKENKK